MSSDSSVPQDVRSKYANEWGLCGDEFHDTAHMSPQLYIREARRLVGETVFTQNSALDKTPRGNESIGMGCCECRAIICLGDFSCRHHPWTSLLLVDSMYCVSRFDV